MSDLTPRQVASVLQKMKGAKQELQDKIDAIEADEDVLISVLLDKMKAEGVESYKTEFGTLTRVIKERFWASDWNVFGDFVLEQGEVGLLERRVHQGNMKEWIKTHPDNFPPSLNVDRKYSITMYKPKKGETP